jgi:4-oxalocrotonate tautomerase
MPHIVVKLWPGKSEHQKQRLADAITKDVMEILNYSEKSISVAMQEVKPEDWAAEVYRPEVQGNIDQLYKKPGYDESDLPT